MITSRVHPGESNSSWMMKGFLDYLTGCSADAKACHSGCSLYLNCPDFFILIFFNIQNINIFVTIFSVFEISNGVASFN